MRERYYYWPNVNHEVFQQWHREAVQDVPSSATEAERAEVETARNKAVAMMGSFATIARGLDIHISLGADLARLVAPELYAQRGLNESNDEFSHRLVCELHMRGAFGSIDAPEPYLSGQATMIAQSAYPAEAWRELVWQVQDNLHASRSEAL
jgi:hypothetical protein